MDIDDTAAVAQAAEQEAVLRIALEALRDLASNRNVDPVVRVEAAKALGHYAMTGDLSRV